MSSSQPLRPKSYLFKNCLRGLTLIVACVVVRPVLAQSTAPITNQAEYNYQVSGEPVAVQGVTNLANINDPNGLIDPLGTITGCDGRALASYANYTVALYDSAPDKLNLGKLLRLDGTTAENGLAPNLGNVNPYSLNDSRDGKYNFLFNRSQLIPGRSYILVVSPPADSTYGERRVRIDLTGFDNQVLTYQATSLDGKQISTTQNNTKSVSVNVDDAATVGLSLVNFQALGTSVCDNQENQAVQIIKSADRQTAEPGDTVVYLLALRNQSDKELTSLSVVDTLPLGMFLRTNSIRAQLGTTPVPFTVSQQGNVVTFKIGSGFVVPARQTVNLAYAVSLDADAIRGSGKNIATLTAIRSDNTEAKGDASHTLSIRQGLIRDTGTIIGRVFIDKNFDGQQQPNEPGVPNAVVYLDDGNRVTTDVNGLFSVQSAVAGYRTGVLDLTSLPGYSLAPNLYFSERNSLSRLVKLAPGGIVRMNFGVTPTAREVKK